MKKTIVLTLLLIAGLGLAFVVGNYPTFSEPTTQNIQNAHTGLGIAITSFLFAMLFNWILPEDNKQSVKQ